VSSRCETDTVPLLGKRSAVDLRIMTGLETLVVGYYFQFCSLGNPYAAVSTAYVRVKMEMNRAFSDSEVEVIKILNKGLRSCPIRMVPCRRYEAKSCHDVATAVVTCTCQSRASLLHILPCRP
jgi:hypothetical protein